MKVWITKWALTSGIAICEDAISMSDGGSPIAKINRYRDRKGEHVSWLQPYFRKPDWHESIADARSAFDEMRARKIASLRKQIARLEKLTFESMLPDENNPSTTA